MKALILFVCSFFIAANGFAEPAKRIVSIGGANTEILFALGAGARVVGTDTTSSYPAKVDQIDKVGYMRALSAEGVLSLDPDLVILNDQAGPPPVLAQLEKTGVRILTLKAARSVEDIVENVSLIASHIGAEDQAKSVRSKILAESNALQEALSTDTNTVRVMFILQHGGGAPMVAGTNTAAHSIITLSGAKNAVTEYEGYKPLTPEAALQLKPDFILVTQEGLQQAGGVKAFRQIPGINLTSAAQNNRVIAMDSLYLLGFGPRTAQAALKLRTHYKDVSS